MPRRRNLSFQKNICNIYHITSLETPCEAWSVEQEDPLPMVGGWPGVSTGATTPNSSQQHLRKSEQDTPQRSGKHAAQGDTDSKVLCIILPGKILEII